MTSPKLPIPVTPFINIQVTVVQKPSGTGSESYDVFCNPESITVTAPDSVINYQLVEPTPQEIVFSGVDTKPDHNHQLSAATISVSGKLLTLSDANTKDQILDLTLKFHDKRGKEIAFDPQVINRPDAM
ncbi:MAG: hypothetical protein Q8R69_10245 [Telluria sp.]|nr:hypothetical protein [Telluria sp.]